MSILGRRPLQIPLLALTTNHCFVRALRTALLQQAIAMRHWTLVVLALFCGTRASPAEHRLYEDLMSTYDPRERPVKNSTAAIVINLGITLNQIIDLDEKNQILTVNAWLKYVSAHLLCILEARVIFFRTGRIINSRGIRKNTAASPMCASGRTPCGVQMCSCTIASTATLTRRFVQTLSHTQAETSTGFHLASSRSPARSTLRGFHSTSNVASLK